MSLTDTSIYLFTEEKPSHPPAVLTKKPTFPPPPIGKKPHKAEPPKPDEPEKPKLGKVKVELNWVRNQHSPSTKGKKPHKAEPPKHRIKSRSRLL